MSEDDEMSPVPQTRHTRFKSPEPFYLGSNHFELCAKLDYKIKQIRMSRF